MVLLRLEWHFSHPCCSHCSVVRFCHCHRLAHLQFRQQATDDAELAIGMATMPQPPARRPAPDIGVVPSPYHDFDEAFSNFCFATHLTCPEAIDVLHRLRLECARVARSGPLKADSSKSCRLEEFDHMHASSVHVFATSTCDSWSGALRNHINNAFRSIGKGWYNLAETDSKVGLYSCMTGTGIGCCDGVLGVVCCVDLRVLEAEPLDETGELGDG